MECSANVHRNDVDLLRVELSCGLNWISLRAFLGRVLSGFGICTQVHSNALQIL